MIIESQPHSITDQLKHVIGPNGTARYAALRASVPTGNLIPQTVSYQSARNTLCVGAADPCVDFYLSLPTEVANRTLLLFTAPSKIPIGASHFIASRIIPAKFKSKA